MLATRRGVTREQNPARCVARSGVVDRRTLLGIPLRFEGIIGRQPGDAPPRIAKTRNYSLINCQRSQCGRMRRIGRRAVHKFHLYGNAPIEVAPLREAEADIAERETLGENTLTGREERRTRRGTQLPIYTG